MYLFSHSQAKVHAFTFIRQRFPEETKEKGRKGKCEKETMIPIQTEERKDFVCAEVCSGWESSSEGEAGSYGVPQEEE